MTVPSVIEAALRNAVQDRVFPGCVLAVRLAGELKFIAAAGTLASDPGSRPVDSSTVYDLASLTKPLVTVTSILLLVQESQLSLDAAANSILPELEGRPIGSSTPRHLLSHCTGLPGWGPLSERLTGQMPAGSMPEAIRPAVLNMIREEPLIYEPGSRSLYSDLGFILLGFMIEQIGGRRLDRWFQTRLAGPLGASPLMFLPTGAARSDRTITCDRLAPTEWNEAEQRYLCGEVHDDNALAMGGVAGHAGLFGTAAAVLKISEIWLNAWQGKPSPLDPDLVRLFTRRDGRIPGSSWALGWDTPTEPSSSGAHFSPESFGHLGYTGTSLWIDPLVGMEVVLLSNRVHPSRKNEQIRRFRPVIHDLIMEEYGVRR